MGERIAVVIPAYRVAEHIQGVIHGMPRFVSDIVVVDDASPDNTAEIIVATGDDRVHLVQRADNGGVGAAMLSGYHRAVELGATIAVKMDGDGQMDPAYLPTLIEPIILGDADYVKGNRFLHMTQLAQMPLLRRLGNIGLSFLSKLSSGYWEIFDPANGYTAIDIGVAELLDSARIHHRWFFETSMLIELGALRAAVRDVYLPAKYGQEHSTLSETKVLRDFPPRLIAACLRRVWLQYFVRDFSAFSLFVIAGLALGLFGLGWGIWHWVETARTGVTATTGTVMLSVLPLILAVQLLLQAAVIDIGSSPQTPLSARHRQLKRSGLRE